MIALFLLDKSPIDQIKIFRMKIRLIYSTLLSKNITELYATINKDINV